MKHVGNMNVEKKMYTSIVLSCVDFAAGTWLRTLLSSIQKQGLATGLQRIQVIESTNIAVY